MIVSFTAQNTSLIFSVSVMLVITIILIIQQIKVIQKSMQQENRKISKLKKEYTPSNGFDNQKLNVLL